MVMQMVPPEPPLVLIVEDEPRIRRLVTRGAKERGFEVLEAGNGVEAMEIVEAQGVLVSPLATLSLAFSWLEENDMKRAA